MLSVYGLLAGAGSVGSVLQMAKGLGVSFLGLR